MSDTNLVIAARAQIDQLKADLRERVCEAQAVQDENSELLGVCDDYSVIHELLNAAEANHQRAVNLDDRHAIISTLALRIGLLEYACDCYSDAGD